MKHFISCLAIFYTLYMFFFIVIENICSSKFVLTQHIEVDRGDGGEGDVVVSRDAAQLGPSEAPDEG